MLPGIRGSVNEGETAGFVGHHDVAIPQIALIDGKGGTHARAPQIDAAERKSRGPRQPRARVQEVAAGSRAPARAYTTREAALHVGRP